MAADLFAPRRALRPPDRTPPATRRLQRRRDPHNPSIAGTVLYLPWWQIRVIPHESADDDGWLCSRSYESATSPDPLLIVYGDDIATAISYDDYPLTAAELAAVWLTTVEARCGATRNGLAGALAEIAHPRDLSVRVDRDAYRTRLGRRTHISSYAGFCCAVQALVRAGLLAPVESDRSRYLLVVSTNR